MKSSDKIALVLTTVSLMGWLGCDKKPSSTTTKNGTTAKSEAHDHEHADGDSHVHSDDAGHDGPMTDLGSSSIGSFTMKASRGQIAAGSDAPINAWLTPSVGGANANVVAVRFWVGTQSGAESVKAKAEIEDPAQPNHWHGHAEVPNPIPAGSRLWVEIEFEGQGKQAGSFDLKM